MFGGSGEGRAVDARQRDRSRAAPATRARPRRDFVISSFVHTRGCNYSDSAKRKRAIATGTFATASARCSPSLRGRISSRRLVLISSKIIVPAQSRSRPRNVRAPQQIGVAARFRRTAPLPPSLRSPRNATRRDLRFVFSQPTS